MIYYDNIWMNMDNMWKYALPSISATIFLGFPAALAISFHSPGMARTAAAIFRRSTGTSGSVGLSRGRGKCGKW